MTESLNPQLRVSSSSRPGLGQSKPGPWCSHLWSPAFLGISPYSWISHTFWVLASPHGWFNVIRQLSGLVGSPPLTGNEPNCRLNKVSVLRLTVCLSTLPLTSGTLLEPMTTWMVYSPTHTIPTELWMPWVGGSTLPGGTGDRPFPGLTLRTRSFHWGCSTCPGWGVCMDGCMWWQSGIDFLFNSQ